MRAPGHAALSGRSVATALLGWLMLGAPGWAAPAEEAHPAHAPARPPVERPAAERSEPSRAPPSRPAYAPAAPAVPAASAAPAYPARAVPVRPSTALAGSRSGTPGTAARTMNGLLLDARYNHGRYYAPVGTVTRVLPPDHRPYYLQGRRYYFSNGVWYAPGGTGFVVVAAPLGIVVAALPPFYTTVWYAGVPYYYADNTYYSWQPDQSGYAVVAPPDDSAGDGSAAGSSADGPAAPDPGSSGAGVAPPANGTPDFIIYPKNGQSREQQAADEYDCGNWARGQSGFDPALAGGGVAAANADSSHATYDRAFAACLQGRGYQLN